MVQFNYCKLMSLIIFKKFNNQIKDYKHISTNILGLTLINIGYGTN